MPVRNDLPPHNSGAMPFRMKLLQILTMLLAALCPRVCAEITISEAGSHGMNEEGFTKTLEWFSQGAK